MAKIFVGTSGWNYAHWKENFYPAGMSQKNWLSHYAGRFNCVELNVTFYRLVPKTTFLGWYEKTPKKFRLVAKGSRFITHIKRLQDVREPLGLFVNNTSGLKEKLAAFLWQFPPNMAKDTDKLRKFLGLLQGVPVRQIFEFRHETWFDEEIYELLKQGNACLCLADSDRYPGAREVTSDFLYLRFHGRGSLYGGNYRRQQLLPWARFVKQHKSKDLYAFFNNDAHGYAVKNALTFRELVK